MSTPASRRRRAAVAAQIKKAIFDDPQFLGTNWHPTQGITVSQTSAPSGLTGRPAGAAQFALTAAYPAGASVHGVAFDSVSVTNQASRTVQLQFRNAYLRYLSTYVQFANENGDLPVANPTKEDTSRAKFLSWINSNYTILGIPLFGNDIPQSSVQFDVPADASIAKVYFGSLGLGGQAFCPESLDGSILTLILNLGVPTILLAAGIAMTGALIKQLSKQIGVGVVQVIRASLPLILGVAVPDIANGIFGTANSGNAVGVLTSLGNAIISAFFASGEAASFLVELGVAVIAGQAIDCTGPIALIFRAIAVLADVAMIAQTVGEVLASPALFINELSLTQTTTVTISHDMNDFQFPATARKYEVILTYDSASTVAHKQCGTIEPGRTADIVAVFDNVPSGGMVTVDVYLTTDSGCIVGRSTGQDGTTPGPYGPVPGTQASIDLTIKELLIPLLQTTQYLHDVKLEYQSGQHVWVETAAPTATIANLGQGQENALYDLNGITISQRTGMAGYAFRAGGQGVPFCGQTISGIEYMVQNVFLGDDPDRALKQLPCGFQQVAGIVYDRLGPVSGVGRNFFLQPTPNGFFVQSITLDDTTPINVHNPLSWGVFSQALDSLAVVPTGYLVGVNTMNHQMLILELPPAPVDAGQAPQAVPFAVTKMGLGTRAGLLSAPVAVAVIDATILILEDGNQRIQAVDVSGNPVLIFHNGTSNIVTLEQGTGITYLDLGVEGIGYLYVLSFVNDGMAAADYRLDVYDPQGNFLTRTTGVAAARMTVDTFRNVYTLNYEMVANAPRIEPSLSQWNPSTPGGCPTPPVTPSVSCPTAPPTPSAPHTFSNGYTLNHNVMGDAPRIEPWSHRCAARLHRRPWRAAVSALALACAAFVLAACDDGGGGGGGGSGVEYFPAGGVSESMRVARRNARLNLDHTVVTWLEAAGGHDNDTGSEDGVDEFIYHFEEPTEIRLSLDRFDEAPQLIALDASGNEIARATASADATITLSGENTLRFVHPHAGDATAAPFMVFLDPSFPRRSPPASAGRRRRTRTTSRP